MSHPPPAAVETAAADHMRCLQALRFLRAAFMVGVAVLAGFGLLFLLGVLTTRGGPELRELLIASLRSGRLGLLVWFALLLGAFQIAVEMLVRWAAPPPDAPHDAVVATEPEPPLREAMATLERHGLLVLYPLDPSDPNVRSSLSFDDAGIEAIRRLQAQGAVVVDQQRCVVGCYERPDMPSAGALARRQRFYVVPSGDT